MKTKTTLTQVYSFPGFRARARFKCGVFQDPTARVITLVRRKKKRFVRVANAVHKASMTIGSTAFVIWMPVVLESIWSSSIGEWSAVGVRP
jgi:hypothetical protein